MALPVSFYESLDMSDVWIQVRVLYSLDITDTSQVIMDLTPEVLFWLTYVILVMLWAAMYYGSMNINKDAMLQKVFIRKHTFINLISVGILHRNYSYIAICGSSSCNYANCIRI